MVYSRKRASVFGPTLGRAGKLFYLTGHLSEAKVKGGTFNKMIALPS